ncbi:MAG TPA: ABC transporter ATP-binding protein [Tepidisphaeraceae bacterium]|jgi:ABC-2 type transport system ATP-binding protein|nr:ABC transporter ATP-binding protein [Tepidisphaeraceae bacterium]
MSDYVIQTHHLTRYFGRKKVVHDMNLAVPRGSIFGFLGRNGSGKTTSLRMILGLLRPTWGSSTILGHDSQNLPAEVRARIGYLAEGHPVYGWMRVKDAKAFQSQFYPKWNDELFDSVLEFFRVDSKNRAKNLSRGERAGLCLAMTLAPEPDLLILDDPAIGLDPVARRSLLESMVYATRKADRTIIFSSHLLSDIERMADHIAVLDYSVLRAQCSLETFRSCVQQFVLTFADSPPEMRGIRGVIQCIPRGNQLRLTLVNVTDETRNALRALGAMGVEEIPINLEDAFVSYLGGSLETVKLPEKSEAKVLAGGVS